MKYLIFLLLFVPRVAFPQQIETGSFWHVTVSDALTGKKIPRATMSISNKRYFIANSNGQIAIDKKYLNLNDTLKVSCVGYQLKAVIVEKKFAYPDSIKLSAVNIALNEVVVNSSKRQLKIGDVKKVYSSHLRTNPNSIFAQYIPNDKGISGIITTIEYFVNDESRGIERPFKVGLYTKSKDNVFPDQKLLNDSVVIFNPKKKKRIVVDVSKYNISFPKDGIMAVFETLCPESYGSDQYWENGQLYSRVPGIDMDLKKKGDFSADLEKLNRTTPYALVMDTTADERFTIEDVHQHAFIYTDGNNFAIVITVEQ
ncbi:hypothetical protein SAMN05216524_109229 [Mucilaginibacter sp. OK098]|nr:hypothetical protein SAMN05216524_109229 [Mucilaginibacter sp. OK098]